MALRQHGVFTEAQAAADGRSGRDRRSMLAQGRWVPVLPGVYRHRDLEPTPWLRAQAAVLGSYPDRVVSHHTAAALWQLAVADHASLHTIRRNGLSTSELTEHRLRLNPDEVIRESGVALTDRHRTMIDLLCAESVTANVAWLVEEFRGGRLGTADLDRLGRRIRGRTGAKRARSLLVSCRGLPYSVLEWNFHRIAWSVSETGWLFNHPVPDDRGLIGIVDVLHEPSRLVVELDGKQFHADDRFQADRTRDQRLAAAGFRWAGSPGPTSRTIPPGWPMRCDGSFGVPASDRGSLAVP